MSKKRDFQFVKDFFLSKGLIVFSDKYINNKQKIDCVDKYGYKYQISYNNLSDLKKDYNSAKFHYYNDYTVDNIKNYFIINNIPLQLLDADLKKISVKKDKLTMLCSCGKTFTSTFSQLYCNGRFRCPSCAFNKSQFEIFVSQYLFEKQIDFVEQFSFDNCKIKRKCKFDFYLPDYNTVIEVHGQQHYYESKMFVLSLLEQQERDIVKKEYCLNNNIKYVVIPYWNFKNNEYKTIIDKIN